jgi:trk system potassium uptake protein TrkA
MFILIAGGQLTGAQLASRLLAKDHRVCLVEHHPDVLERIHRELPTEAIYEGNVADPQTLEQAGIRDAQTILAFTAHDATNLVLCFVARTIYKVPRTMAVINDPRNAWLFDEKFCVDMALDTTDILTHLIEEEMTPGDMMTLLKLRRGEFSLVEQVIGEGAKAIGVPVADLPLPDQCVLTAIMRRGELVVPRGSTVLEPGDEVLALTDTAGAAELEILLGLPNPALASQSNHAPG